MALSCTVIRDLLPLYAEDLLREENRKLVEDHLASCQACQKELEAMREPAPPQPETLPLLVQLTNSSFCVGEEGVIAAMPPAFPLSAYTEPTLEQERVSPKGSATMPPA